MRAAWLALLLVAGCVDLTVPPRLTAGPDATVDRPGADRPGVDGPGAERPADASAEEAGDDATIADAGDDGPLSDAAADAPPAPPDSVALLASGAPCATADQCQSLQCVDGVCCNSPCGVACYSCVVPGLEGKCSPVPAGQSTTGACPLDDPGTCARDGTCDGMGGCRTYPAGTQCAPPSCAGATEYAASACDGAGRCLAGTMRSCAPNLCVGNTCRSMCTTSADCQSGFFCDGGTCAVNKGAGTACTGKEQCASHYCVDGVCCSTPCTDACFSCSVAGSAGTCVATPSGRDPRSECPQEPASTCGRAGGCNGRGACLRYPAGATCSAASCSGVTLSGTATCDGLGACRAGTTTSCAPYLCRGTVCPTACTTPADCQSGFACLGGTCVLSNLLLGWAFDETGGSTALDSSGNGFSGQYVGSTGAPTPSTVVPTVRFPDTQSRAFVGTRRQAVQLAAFPAALRPANNLTVSAWYRATSVDSSGADLISGGDQYVLRLRPTQIEFSKRIRNQTYAQCIVDFSRHLDGAWHHMAGVTSGAGTKLYFDGVETCSSALGDDIVYDRGPDLFVGRHGNGQTTWDFDGNIDDVRIYGRAFSAAEIASLAAGNH
jgi:hypothetical protein